MILEEIIRELQPDILPGSSRPDPHKTILQAEFYRYANVHHTSHVYLVDQTDLDSLSFPPREDVLVLFVACANGLQPNFNFPANYSPLFIRDNIKHLTSRCTFPFDRESSRQQIQSLFQMGEKAHLSVVDLLSAACLPLSIGVCLLRDGDELVMEDCADSIFQAYMPDGGKKDSFFQAAVSQVREVLRRGESPCYRDGLCYEFTAFPVHNFYRLTLVVFYDNRTSFDFAYFARKTRDYATRQTSLAYGALDQPNPDTALRQILNGTMQDYPAVADILYGAEHQMKGFRLLQIRPADPAVPWQQWTSALRVMLRNAFHWVHIHDDGSVVTALTIAKFPTPKDHTETKNFCVPEVYYKPGWDLATLERMLRQANAESMLSAATSALDMIPLIHQQTRLTLEIASRLERNPGASHFWYHTDYLPYLPIHYSVSQFLPSQTPKALGLWFHPEAFRLLRNDVFENKDLAQVLYCYLQNGMDVGEVAQQLYMHRNTVYARLKAIEAFTGRSLKDSIFHNCFLPSLRFYYYCSRYLNISDEHLLLVNRPDSFTDGI